MYNKQIITGVAIALVSVTAYAGRKIVNNWRDAVNQVAEDFASDDFPVEEKSPAPQVIKVEEQDETE